MRTTVVAVALLASLAVAQEQAPRKPVDQPLPPPFGVAMPVQGMSAAQRVAAARALGATWYKPEAVLIGADAKCGECTTAREAGLKLVVAIRNARSEKDASRPVADAEKFRAAVARVVDEFRPEVLVVEQEPDNAKRYSGTAQQYAEELKIACGVAHEKSVDCANGGVQSEAVLGVVLDELYRRDPAAAIGFATDMDIVRYAGGRPLFVVQGRAKGDRKSIEERIQKCLREHHDEIVRARAFLDVAVNEPLVSRVNFHWYWPRTKSIAAVVETLRALGKRPLMCDEAGALSNSSGELTDNLTALQSATVYPIIWFAADSREGSVALVDKSGKLKAIGEAFRRVATKVSEER